MKHIGLLSDTHGFLDERIFKFFDSCDFVWHAGDLGSYEVLVRLEKWKPLIAVFGNVDNYQVRSALPETQRFSCEGIDVMIKHIGGYPGKYDPSVLPILQSNPPKLFITGHSHILKVINDKRFDLLHINPGAAGNSGIHKVKTLVRFTIDGNKICDLEIMEIERGN